MFPNTVTQAEIVESEWLENLEICICGSIVRPENDHSGCIISGISRQFFTDISGWKVYSKENGQRIAQYYRNTARVIAPYKAAPVK